VPIDEALSDSKNKTEASGIETEFPNQITKKESFTRKNC